MEFEPPDLKPLIMVTFFNMTGGKSVSTFGGHWPGYPDETSTFPQHMLVDYVRVYQRS